jgi:hypothetical protein
MEMTLGKGFIALKNEELLAVDGGGWLATTITVVGLTAAVVGLAMAVAACPPVAIVVAPSVGYLATSIGLGFGGGATAAVGAMFL